MPHNLYLHGALVRLRGFAEENETPLQASGEGSDGGIAGEECLEVQEKEPIIASSAGVCFVEDEVASESSPTLSTTTAHPTLGLSPGLSIPGQVGSACSSGDPPPTDTSTNPGSEESDQAAAVVPRRDDAPGIKESLELGTWDNILSLSSAFAVNSAIVILAASSFHAGVASGTTDLEDASSLSGAYVLLEPALGRASSILFAVALLCSGQSSTFTGTMAGQVVMEGFLRIKLKPMVRRILTRTVAILPAAVAVVIAGDAGLDRLLVLSQVTLSFQLPFAIIPLVYFCSCKWALGPFAVSRFTSCVGWAVCLFILFLNAYMVYTIGMGQ